MESMESADLTLQGCSMRRGLCHVWCGSHTTLTITNMCEGLPYLGQESAKALCVGYLPQSSRRRREIKNLTNSADKKTEEQKGEVICLGTHSWQWRNWIVNPSSLVSVHTLLPMVLSK